MDLRRDPTQTTRTNNLTPRGEGHQRAPTAHSSQILYLQLRIPEAPRRDAPARAYWLPWPARPPTRPGCTPRCPAQGVQADRGQAASHQRLQRLFADGRGSGSGARQAPQRRSTAAPAAPQHLCISASQHHHRTTSNEQQASERRVPVEGRCERALTGPILLITTHAQHPSHPFPPAPAPTSARSTPCWLPSAQLVRRATRALGEPPVTHSASACAAVVTVPPRCSCGPALPQQGRPSAAAQRACDQPAAQLRRLRAACARTRCSAALSAAPTLCARSARALPRPARAAAPVRRRRLSARPRPPLALSWAQPSWRALHLPQALCTAPPRAQPCLTILRTGRSARTSRFARSKWTTAGREGE